jgi:hypothetical protein
MCSKKLLTCGKGKQKVNKSFIISTELSPTPLEKGEFYHTFKDRGGARQKLCSISFTRSYLEGR